MFDERPAQQRIAEVRAKGGSALDLSECGLTAVPRGLASLHHLRYLDLSGNRLSSLPESIGDLTELTTLDLSGNLLSRLPETIGSLTAVTDLDLHANRLTGLPESLGKLTDLVKIDLSGNTLTTVPDAVGNLHSLVELHLQNNRLSRLPDLFGKLVRLTLLSLSSNRLHELPASMGQLVGLVWLRLASNLLGALPEWIGNLTKITELDLYDTGLTSLPKSIGKLVKLVNLDVRCNRLTELPQSIGSLADLTHLRLRNNQLTELPQSIGNLCCLTDLDFHGNGVTKLPESIGDLTNLVGLDCGNNRLAVLPDSIGNLASLRALHLGYNCLTTVPASIGSLASLVQLDLSGNALTVLPQSIGGAVNLTSLGLRGNRLNTLPDSIGKLTRLTHLGLNGNRLTKLPESIGGLARLTDLDVSGNPLASPPPVVVAEGTRAVLAFLRERQGQHGVPQWRSKLLIVGQGGAGKTSLVNAVARKPHNPKEVTTHGLRVSSLTMSHPVISDVFMDLSIWDFGGQEIYHATHQFFLTDQSLFVLVWNARAGWEHGRLRYWLDLIHARAPEAPIVLVATHTDDRAADLPLDALRHDFPQIRASCLVDNASGTGIDDARTVLARYAAELPLMGQKWPDTWLAAAAACQEAERNYVTWVEFDRLLARAGVNKSDSRRLLTSVLHQLGEILYYGDDDDLADIVVLRPQWLNSYVSRILDCQPVAARAGLLVRADVNREWADIDPALRDHFLQMMDKYDVSYQISDRVDDAIAVVVDRLPWTPPDYQDQWDTLQRPDNTEIRVRYTIGGSVIPPGIPTWFIARSHRFTIGRHWRTGVVLRHPDGAHLGLVVTDTERNNVDLAVRGPLPAAFFAVLDDGLNVTFNRYPGLKITRLVPCICSNDPQRTCPTMYDYAKLIARLKSGRPTVECDDSYQAVDITSMLFGITPASHPTATTDVLIAQLEQHTEQILSAVTVQTELLQREFMKTHTLIARAQQVQCPSVFTLTRLRRHLPGVARLKLRLYCEEPGAWHPLPGEQGCYQISQPDEWLAKAGPHLARLLRIMKHLSPLVGPALGIAASALRERLSDDLADMKDLLDTATDEFESFDARPHPGRLQRRDLRLWADNDADFRVIEQMLVSIDPSRRWGGLSRTLTPEGLTLFLCPKHYEMYR